MDDIERRVRAARPLSGGRGLPLTDRAKRELAELLVSGVRGPQDRYRELAMAATRELEAGRGSGGGVMAASRRGYITGIAACAALLMAFVVATPFGGAPAVALTPPPLTVVPLGTPRDEVIADLAAAARSQPLLDPDEPQVIETIGWWLHISAREDGTLVADETVIRPEERVETIHPDGARSLTVAAGEPWDGSGVRPADSPVPGTVLAEQAWGPGEYESGFPRPTFSDAGTLRTALLETGPDSMNDPFLSFYEVQALASEWRLTGGQMAEIIEFLGSFREVGVAGATTDRLGRAAIALAARNAEGTRTASLLLDPETGRLLAAETVQLTDDLAGVDAPAVTSYTLWK